MMPTAALTVSPTIIEGSPEKRLRTSLVEGYEKQAEDLDRTGQANDTMFGRVQIVEALTHEVLERALRISKLGGVPKGILVADNDPAAKVRAIDEYMVSGQRSPVRFFHPNDQKLWNSGNDWPNPDAKGWQYAIMDGVDDVRLDADDEVGGGDDNYAKIQALVRRYGDVGLDVVSGADSYLALARQMFLEGTPIDSRFWTVLNARNLTRGSIAGVGLSDHGQIVLSFADPSCHRFRFRLRAMTVVDVPEHRVMA